MVARVYHEVPSLGGGGDQRVDEREGAVASCIVDAAVNPED
jgi:hypothetical protein